MSLIHQLSGEEKYINLFYYGMNDMSTGFDMKDIVDSKDIIRDFFVSNHNMKIETIDDYFGYNYAVKILKMKEIIPNIIDGATQKDFAEIVEIVDVYLKTISNGDIVKFINNNYEKIFQKHDYILGLIDATLLLFERYKSGIDTEVLQYIVENRTYLIVSHYDVFGPMIEKNDLLLNLFFSEPVISQIFLKKQEGVQKLLLVMNNKGKIKNFEEIIDGLAKIVEAKYFAIDDENIMANEICIRNFVEFLVKIKHVKANLFKNYYNSTSEKMNDYLQRKGHHSAYEIPVGEILQRLKNIEPREYSLLMVSHGMRKGNIVSHLEFPSEGQHTIMDIAASNMKTDNYYTVSHIHRLEISMVVGASTMQGILFDDEMFEESRRCLLGYLLAICEIKKWDAEEYQDDVEILYQMLNICRELPDVDNIAFSQGICYGTCAHICGVTEKIIRDIYVEENKELIFIDESQITIGQLLRNSSGTIGKIFSENQLKHLRYCFSTDTEQKIGLNYRNRIAHYTIDKRNLNISFVAKMMYLLVDILNSIFLYVQK